MAKELKACPFCGGDAESRLFDAQYFVQCVQCFNSTAADHELESSAIAAWNARANYAPEHLQVEAVKVVGYLSHCTDGYDPDARPPPPQEPLMTVTQHQRILAAATHPADQVAEPDAELVALMHDARLQLYQAYISREDEEELQQIIKRIDSKLASLKGAP